MKSEVFVFAVLVLGLFRDSTGEDTGGGGANTSAILFPASTKQNGGCRYSHTFSNVGENIYLNSENYPYTYYNNLDCKYTIESPKGTQMILECDDFNVEYEQYCRYDVFYWSLTGDPNFGDSRYSCGSPSLSPKKTYANKLTIGFRSDYKQSTNQVYRYRCKISVVPTPCSCGMSGATTRIVGGTEAQVAEFPWRVALFTSKDLFCTGSLIHNSWVLTAAHCIDSVESGETLYADIGDHNVRRSDDANNQVITVDRVMKNSMYNDKNQDNDIALLHLSRPVQYAKNIQPLCLPWKYTSSDFNGVTGIASGWGTLGYGKPRSEVLLKVDLTMMNTPNCRSAYDRINRERNINVTITNNMFCAYKDNKDTCQGDSGGSLDYKDVSLGRHYGVGVISFGLGCGVKDTPGVYTQLVNYLGWIEQNTGETYCKE